MTLIAVGATARQRCSTATFFEGDYRPKMSEGKGAQIVDVLIPRIEALTGQEFTQAYKDNIAMSPTGVLASKYSAQAAALVHDQGTERKFAVSWKACILVKACPRPTVQPLLRP